MNKQLMQLFMPPKKMIEMFTLSHLSDTSIDEIAGRVSKECENFKFALLYTYNYHEIVESKGFPIKRKVYIYEICQAKTAALMLTSNPEFSIFMPCKLTLFENEGKTVISTMNMEIMLDAVKSNKNLYDNAISIFNNLKSMMNALSN